MSKPSRPGFQKILVSLAEEVIRDMNFIASAEGRTRSDLIREAVRDYTYNYKLKARAVSLPDEPTPLINAFFSRPI
jgi:metal-responsive CopG/Arc/MetJ family transcriptional regulator